MKNISSSSSSSSSTTMTTTTTAQSVPDMVAAIRFHPTEDEKADFLRKKMKNHNSQACLFLPVIDHRKFEPWELPESMFPESPYQAKAWYSFSWCDYKSNNSPRFKRKTERGFWKMNGHQRDVGPKHFTCKKRTLTFRKKTFQEGRRSKSVTTNWKMHEYIRIKSKRGSSPHQARDQQRGLVLCVLKYKPADSKSNKKKLKGTSIRGDFADSTDNRGYIASSSGEDEAATAAATNHMSPDTEEVLAYKQLEHDLLGSGNQDDGEPGGGSSSEFNQSLRDMIQEFWWQLCPPAGEYLNSHFPLPEPPQPHQPPQLGNAPDVCSGELVDPGTSGCITYNTDNQAATMNHMVSDTEEILAFKQLERDVFAGGNHNGGEPGSGNLTFGDGNDETGGWKFSDFDDRAASDMFQELFREMGEILNSSSQPLQPPQQHQPPQPHQPQDYCSSTLQAPLHTLPGNVSYVYGDCTRRQSLIPDNISYLGYKNNISTCDPNEQVSKLNGVHDRATEEMFSEAFFQPHECMGPPFDPLQDYLLLSPMNTELGDGVHPNNYIGCNDELRSPDDMEIQTRFP
ncbi:uncharacterized protein LOC103927995 isoform X1 [Pyrus x bretschneideri]|uniref:uncharacterized protein LOC103927995 isoform X1 n=1 Tax=Pyrus x bretschneideri TaxID=225117 RepID=UPI00202E1A6D|nr:uncharacterized protein LOC103927995 isoform X1 [Pyrus x bretschneideri]XP_018498260.2 uncharacterized protein LOC103927995 isoform X1 [Pyrus x bretschneideri]